MSDSIDLHGLPAKWRAEAEDCDAKAREREAESPRNGQWFRGCANGHRLAADELDDALRQSGEADRRDAERHRWLRDNAGAWEVSRDVGEWTRTETGEKFKPRVYFSAYSTGYGGLTFDEAIDAAIAAHAASIGK